MNIVSHCWQRAISWLFHRMYYWNYTHTWRNTFWMGTPVLKCPLDLWMYQEILARNRPDLIIECGTYSGGSALFLANICELLGNGRVITIDTEVQPGRPSHSRLTYLTGNTVSPEILATVHSASQKAGSVMVILDSDHHKPHVLAELRAYAPLVSMGHYLIAEDTNLNGRPVAFTHGPGPREAVNTFLRETTDFIVDSDCEKFSLTFNPNGYLRRVREQNELAQQA